jgi:outer membrane protein OmpA-like peptidoglycan-associated protein
MASRRSSGGFGFVSPAERREADLFFAELMGWAQPPPLIEALDEQTGDAACPPPEPIPSRCTGIGLRELVSCFEFDSAAVLPRHQARIINLARCILASQSTSTPITTLRLVGHTDETGDVPYNDALGLRRAEAVKSAIEATLNRMTGNRAPRLTITTSSRGKRELLAGGGAPSRRVEVFPPFAFPVVTPPAARCPSTFEVAPEAVAVEGGATTVLRASDNQTLGATPTFTWTTASSRLTLVGATVSPQSVTGPSVTVRAGTEPHRIPEPGELVEVTRTQSGCAPITRQVRVHIVCERFRLARPRVIAIATDRTITRRATFTDPAIPPSGHTLEFGQDLLFTTGRAQPHGPSVGTTTAALDTQMRNLLTAFASNDTHGKARRLFDAFLAPNRTVRFWSDPDLTSAAQSHANIISWVSRALSAPNSPERSVGQTRIHQALQNANWDINAAVAPTDLGVPAFNRGNKVLGTDDFGNGLGVMINGLQHAIVIAKEYYFDPCRREYHLTLEYVFYDVFGLDDDDLREFGADGGYDSDAAQGITAWWQLQHQHGYAPLITRIAFERRFTVPVP